LLPLWVFGEHLWFKSSVFGCKVVARLLAYVPNIFPIAPPRDASWFLPALLDSDLFLHIILERPPNPFFSKKLLKRCSPLLISRRVIPIALFLSLLIRFSEFNRCDVRQPPSRRNLNLRRHTFFPKKRSLTPLSPDSYRFF